MKTLKSGDLASRIEKMKISDDKTRYFYLYRNKTLCTYENISFGLNDFLSSLFPVPSLDEAGFRALLRTV